MKWDEEEEPEGAPRERNAHSLPTSYPCRRVLLTQAQETRLCDRAQAGDEPARQEMMEANLRLVMAIARRFRGHSMTYEDLVQEGILGLLEAIKRFDGRKGYKFSTYATHWIRQAIGRAMDKQDRLIRLPGHGCSMEHKLGLAEKRLEEELGRPPTIDELARETGFSQAVVRALVLCGSEPLSLDSLTGEDRDTPFMELIPDPMAIDPETNSVSQHTATELLAAVEALSEREAFVLLRRYGFFDGSVWTLQQLADELKMSREGVRHIERRAIRRLHVTFTHAQTFAIPLAGDLN